MEIDPSNISERDLLLQVLQRLDVLEAQRVPTPASTHGENTQQPGVHPEEVTATGLHTTTVPEEITAAGPHATAAQEGRYLHKPRHSLPHPQPFGGLKSAWRSWKVEMENKIEEDAAAIGNSKSKFRYIYASLEGSAKTNVTTYYEAQVKNPNPNPLELIWRLDLLYGERNREAKAVQALHQIKQADNESFASFYPKFEKEISNADAEDWPNKSKISYLRNALNERMKAAMVGNSGGIVEYLPFVTKCEELSNEMELYGQWRNGRRKDITTLSATQSKHTTPAANGMSREDMMEWDPTPASATQINVAKSTSYKDRNVNGYPSKRPEDQPLLGKRAKWCSREEYATRKQEQRCLRCGRTHCRIDRCPLAAAINPDSSRVNTLKPEPVVVTEAVFEDDDE